MLTRIIAHRGLTDQFPENTLAAFLAAKQSGVEGIELDVHSSRDGALVVHHDYYLANGERIHETSWTDIEQLVIEETERIPTLNEVFEALGNSIHYEIELKGIGAGFVPAVINLINHHNLLNQVEITSPHAFTLARVKKEVPAARTGYFVPPRPGWMDQKLAQDLALFNAANGEASVVHAEVDLIDVGLVRRAHAAGLAIHVADCNTAADLEKAFALKADQLSTNIPRLALQIRAR